MTISSNQLNIRGKQIEYQVLTARRFVLIVSDRLMIPFQIGVDFALKVLDKGRDKLVRLQLWDVAGE